MSPERWDQVVAIFHTASEKAADERAAYIAGACGGDEPLRREVELLLREDEESGDFLEVSPFHVQEEPPPLPELKLGAIGHYTLVEKLGEGGMGTVYKAWDHKLDRLVALKFLALRLYSDKEMKSRFLQEARTTSALDHPNICTIYGIEETEDGRMFIVMAYYEGQTLRQTIDIGTLPPKTAIEIAIQVAKGLAKAHSLGIIHRDLKPANVILTPEGIAKVLDFGIAKFGEGQGITRTGSTVGTVAYMSPEQARGKGVDRRTDLWALGVLLYEMLCGHVPFQADNDLGVLYAIVNEEPKPVNTTQTNWPAGMETLLHRSVEKDIALRYQTAEELIEDLESVRAGTAPDSAARRVEQVRKAPSIVVLPFANMSRDPEHEYFGDGLTEELINALSKVEGIQVVSRTTAFQFKDQARDVREIGRKLKASTVLEGSVRAAGNKLRITAQLVNVADGYQLWSDRYDRQLDDVFAVQDEIAQTIVDTLKVRFGGERKQLVKKPTKDREAYQLYLKGRHHCNHWTRTGLERGVELFREALNRDSSFAQAKVGMAEAFLLRGYWGLMPPEEAWATVRTAAREALEIDDELGEAHAALGSVLAVADWDWAGAKSAFDRAIELEPNEPWIRSWYSSLYLSPMNRLDESLAESRRSLEHDPLSPAYSAGVAWVHILRGEHDEAVRHALEGIELAPGFQENHWALAEAYTGQGKASEALRALERAYTISRESSMTLALLVRAMAVAGREREARRFLARLQSLGESRYVSETHFAWARVALDEPDEAFRHLEEAAAAREVMVLYLRSLPMFDKIRGDERCGALTRRIGLEPEARA